ncbi:MAG: hypothetical protein G01um10148_749 [Parcubacteria group bacterium Gr01-1014_8]|nr:MAG: hypothetical protein G01um10148_749 [Parcubacteria group bacterium Gr01-1014_8]
MARTLIVAGVFAVVGVAYVVRGNEPGVTFATHGIDLKIDSQAFYNGVLVPSATWALKNLVPGADKFFNFDDIKPGDFGCNVISMHVKNANAWMCLDFKNLQENENGVNEPEGHEDGAAGAELADGTEFFGWMDDGDGKYEPPNEKPIFGTSTQAASYVFASTTYAIADSRGSMCRLNTKRYVGMCWCAGDLTVQQNGSFNCDANALGNEAQTDSFSVDVSIRAEMAQLKPKFICGGYPPVEPPCPSCNGPINITIVNNGTVNSITTSSSNTGGNTAGGGLPGQGGTVTTGNASSSATTTNTTNTTNINGDSDDIRDLLRDLFNRLR